MVLAASTLTAANPPVWTATIPTPSFPGLVASVASAISNAPTSTLVQVNCVNSQTPPNNYAGTQLVLLDAKGHVLATGEIASVGDGVGFATITILSVTPRKLILVIDGVLNQALIDPNKHFVFEPLPLETGDETLTGILGTADFDKKTIFTTTKVSNLVTQVRRYKVTSLKP